MNEKTKNLSIILFAMIITLAAILYFLLRDEPGGIGKESGNYLEEKLLAGSWVRTDGSYVIHVENVAEDGRLTAKYYNPSPINVSRSEWSKDAGTIKLFVELRDINYPGSKYLLNYLPDDDILAGDYYQAVQGITLYVEFKRIE